MPRRVRVTEPILSWNAEAELVGITLTLQPRQDLQLRSNFTTELHAWLLNQVCYTNPDLSAYLHDGQSEKAFTISGLEEHRTSAARSLQFTSGQSYPWTITALNRQVCEWLQQWLTNPPQEVSLRSGVFKIVQWEVGLPATTYEAIWQQFENETNHARSNTDLSLTFVSATSFRKRQNHMPLPIPENVFHSYLRRWNDFAPITVEQADFLDWVNDCVVILRHEVRSLKVQAGKQGSVTGFVGRVQFGLTPKAKAEPEYVQMVRSLVYCAPYFGTGHKVTFGLGQTRWGWLEQPIVRAAASIGSESVAPTQEAETVDGQKQKLVEARRTELKVFFFSLKKRQGGTRAEKTADLWATILVRQEFGESLKAIAVDLGLSYESVKKYSQLARKEMGKRKETKFSNP